MGRNKRGPRSTAADFARNTRRIYVTKVTELRLRRSCCCPGYSTCTCSCDSDLGAETRPVGVGTGSGAETRPSGSHEIPCGGGNAPGGNSTEGGCTGTSSSDGQESRTCGSGRTRSRSRAKSPSSPDWSEEGGYERQTKHSASPGSSGIY